MADDPQLKLGCPEKINFSGRLVADIAIFGQMLAKSGIAMLLAIAVDRWNLANRVINDIDQTWGGLIWGI
jgi:hypothetical protein